MTPPDPSVSVPIPDLEARAITMQEYSGYAPEKFELIAGYLFLPGAYPELRLKLLRLLLVNGGLGEAVGLAPVQPSRAGLERARDPVGSFPMDRPPAIRGRTLR